jgi:hypothetical protein
MYIPDNTLVVLDQIPANPRLTHYKCVGEISEMLVSIPAKLYPVFGMVSNPYILEIGFYVPVLAYYDGSDLEMKLEITGTIEVATKKVVIHHRLHSPVPDLNLEIIGYELV